MLPKKIHQNGKYALIDAQGNAMTPFYDFIFPFVDGFAVVANGSFLNGNQGVINAEGKEIISVTNRKIHFLSEGHFLVWNTYSDCAFFDTEGKQVSTDLSLRGSGDLTSLKEGLARIELSYSNFSFIDVTGKRAFDDTYSDAGLFCNGLARVQGSNGKWGFINKTGEMVVPCKYQYVKDFSDGLAPVAVLRDPNNPNSWENFWGYINTKGEEVIPLEYVYATYFQHGRALVTKDFGNYKHEYYLIDKTGDIIENAGEHASMDGHYYHIIAKRDGKEGIISTQNEILLPFEYSHIRQEFCSMRTVSKDGFEGMIDMHCNAILPPVYDKVHCSSASGIHDEDVRVSCYGDGFYFDQNTMHRTTIVVEKNGKFGGFPYITNNEMYYTQDFIPVSYARKGLVEAISEYYIKNGCTFPILDILNKLQSENKSEMNLGKDLLKTVNFLMETDQVQGIAIDTNTVLPIAIAWATSALMNERIMSAHLIKALFLQIKKNGVPLIPLDYKIYRAFEAATAKKPFALEEVFEIIVPDFGFIDLFYPFVTNNEPYKAFLDTDLSIKFLDDDGNILSKIPKGTDKTLEKMFKDVTKTYSNLQYIVVQQFSKQKAQGKTWSGAEWKSLFLSNPFYFNLALSLQWKTQNGVQFTLQDDQSTVDANFEEIEIADTEISIN